MYRKNHNVIYLNKENLSVTYTFYIVHCFRYSVDLARIKNSKNRRCLPMAVFLIYALYFAIAFTDNPVLDFVKSDSENKYNCTQYSVFKGRK